MAAHKLGNTYLFIDGEYLRQIYNVAIRSIFACDGSIDFFGIKRQAGAERAFFYDCLEDVPRPNENDVDFAARIAKQEAYFGSIRDLEGFHVRLGSLRGSPKRLRQKEVDVALTVDMLTHGFDGNMGTAILIAGDLDFRPLVEALVRRGVFVEIWYEERSAAQELRWAADFGRALDFGWLYGWSTQNFKNANPLPRVSQAHAPVENITSNRNGVFEGRSVRLMKSAYDLNFVLRQERSDGTYWFDHSNEEVLERYFAHMYGPVQWD